MSVPLLPGTWGACHGSGFLGDMIRAVEQGESAGHRYPNGDREAAWAGHIFVYVGGGQIVEAEWPKVKLSAADSHRDAIWASGQTLTIDQRSRGVSAVMSLVGTPYDAVAYAYFLAKLAELPITKDYDALAAQQAKAGPICSGIMVREQLAMKVDIGPLKTAALQSPDFVSPADCLRWGLDNSWMDKKVPLW